MVSFPRGFGADGGKGESEMNYPCFASAVGRSGFDLSEPEVKQVFNEFRLSGPSGDRWTTIPSGNITVPPILCGMVPTRYVLLQVIS